MIEMVNQHIGNSPVLISTGVWVAFLTLMGLIIRQVGPWHKQSIDSESNFRKTILAELAQVKAELADERRARSNEVGMLRHRLNNSDHALDLFIALIEASPERALEHIAKIKEIRERDRQQALIESAILKQEPSKLAEMLRMMANEEVKEAVEINTGSVD